MDVKQPLKSAGDVMKSAMTHSDGGSVELSRRHSTTSGYKRDVTPLVAGSSCYGDDVDAGAEIQMTAAVSGVIPDDTFTVTQAVNSLGFGKFQILLSFVIGMCWMSDSMEIMILSILSPALHCEWHISQYHQVPITHQQNHHLPWEFKKILTTYTYLLYYNSVF